MKLPNKARSYYSFLIVILGFFIMFNYQNCAPMVTDGSNLSSLSNAKKKNQIHINTDHSDVPKQKNSYTFTSPLMDRAMIYSLFLDIFGPRAAQLQALNKLRSDRAIMGGPCSVYENFKSARNNYGTDSDAENCTNQDSASHLSAPVNPAGNVLQQALINDVCHALVEDSVTYNYVATQLKNDIKASVPENTSENIMKMVWLFYRGKEMPDNSIIENLKQVVQTSATNEGWKNAILITCVSSHWQAL